MQRQDASLILVEQDESKLIEEKTQDIRKAFIAVSKLYNIRSEELEFKEFVKSMESFIAVLPNDNVKHITFFSAFAKALTNTGFRLDNSNFGDVLRHNKINKQIFLLFLFLNKNLEDWSPYLNGVPELKQHLTDVAIIMKNPTISFFKGLGEPIKEKIALSSLKAREPDLGVIPDELLLKAIYASIIPTKNRLNDLAILALQEFRDEYPHPFSKIEALDKRRVLIKILQGRFSFAPDETERLLVRYSLKTLRAYPTKSNMEDKINEVFKTFNANLNFIVETTNTALFTQYNNVLSIKEKQFLRDRIGLIFATELVMGKRVMSVLIEKDTCEQFAAQFATLLRNKPMDAMKTLKESPTAGEDKRESNECVSPPTAPKEISADPAINITVLFKNSLHKLAITSVEIKKTIDLTLVSLSEKAEAEVFRLRS